MLSAAEELWLDMRAFADGDPDEVLTVDEHRSLHETLAVDDAELSDALWDHLLAVSVASGCLADDDVEEL